MTLTLGAAERSLLRKCWDFSIYFPLRNCFTIPCIDFFDFDPPWMERHFDWTVSFPAVARHAISSPCRLRRVQRYKRSFLESEGNEFITWYTFPKVFANIAVSPPLFGNRIIRGIDMVGGSLRSLGARNGGRSSSNSIQKAVLKRHGDWDSMDWDSLSLY